MNDRPRSASAVSAPPGARIARIVIEPQAFDVSVSAPDRPASLDPSDFPLLVEISAKTQAPEARRVRYVRPALSPPRSDGDSPVADPALQTILTDRELQVLNELAKGASNKSIARNLGISTGTVRVHVKSVLRKLALDNRTQAAVWLTTATLERKK